MLLIAMAGTHQIWAFFIKDAEARTAPFSELITEAALTPPKRTVKAKTARRENIVDRLVSMGQTNGDNGLRTGASFYYDGESMLVSDGKGK